MPTLKHFDGDVYRTTCDATVVALHPEGIELDATAFYARNGGQTGDTGTLVLVDGATIAIADAVYSPDRQTVLHVSADNAGFTLLAPGTIITAAIDWDRRYRLMRLHTCLHLLGSLIPAPVTGCGISSDASHTDFDLPESTLDRDMLTTQLNELIGRNTPARIDLITPEELPAQPELVCTIGTASPAGAPAIRIIRIDGTDRQPCGGTHVRATGEIGRVIVTKVGKKSRRNRRAVVAFADWAAIMNKPAALPMQHADHAERRGLLLGFTSVAIFSQTLPFTHVTVAELDATFVVLARAVPASVLAFVLLTVTGAFSAGKRPRGHQWWQLAVTAMGVVVGFPLSSSPTMRDVPTAYGVIIVGLLPLATVIFAAWFGRKQPSPGFWLCAVIGSVPAVSSVLLQGAGALHRADWLFFAAMTTGALGYATGGKLARKLDGTRTIAWALVVSLPVLLPIVRALVWMPSSHQAEALVHASSRAWMGLAYVSALSIFIGFLFWYSGLAAGNVVQVGQIQLLQPFMTLINGWLLLGESLDAPTILFTLTVIAVVGIGRRTSVHRQQRLPSFVDRTYQGVFMTASYDAQTKLKQLGIELPAAGAPAAAYVMAAQTGNQVFLSGHIAKKDGKPWVSELGADMTTEQGKAATRAIAIDLIATLNTCLGGDLSRAKRIVKVMSLVNSTREFTEQHLVTNDASELFVEVFSGAGKHTRSAFGVAQIPFGACIEIELIAEVV